VQIVSDSMAVLRSVEDAQAGTRLRIRVADGAVTTLSEGLDEAH
jgi:exodeoxyribonuclease VII large subunit